MLRWVVLPLLVLNLGVFLWGWIQDGPIEAPLPPLTSAPGEIRLVSELPRPAAGSGGRLNPGHAQFLPASGTKGAGPQTLPPLTAPVREAVAPLPQAPVSAYDGGAVRPLPRVSLPETLRERVDPGLLPDELSAEPPVVIPPVREEDAGTTHTWSRGG